MTATTRSGGGTPATATRSKSKAAAATQSPARINKRSLDDLPATGSSRKKPRLSNKTSSNRTPLKFGTPNHALRSAAAQRGIRRSTGGLQTPARSARKSLGGTPLPVPQSAKKPTTFLPRPAPEPHSPGEDVLLMTGPTVLRRSVKSSRRESYFPSTNSKGKSSESQRHVRWEDVPADLDDALVQQAAQNASLGMENVNSQDNEPDDNDTFGYMAGRVKARMLEPPSPEKQAEMDLFDFYREDNLDGLQQYPGQPKAGTSNLGSPVVPVQSPSRLITNKMQAGPTFNPFDISDNDDGNPPQMDFGGEYDDPVDQEHAQEAEEVAPAAAEEQTQQQDFPVMHDFEDSDSEDEPETTVAQPQHELAATPIIEQNATNLNNDFRRQQALVDLCTDIEDNSDASIEKQPRTAAEITDLPILELENDSSIEVEIPLPIAAPARTLLQRLSAARNLLQTARAGLAHSSSAKTAQSQPTLPAPSTTISSNALSPLTIPNRAISIDSEGDLYENASAEMPTIAAREIVDTFTAPSASIGETESTVESQAVLAIPNPDAQTRSANSSTLAVQPTLIERRALPQTIERPKTPEIMSPARLRTVADGLATPVQLPAPNRDSPRGSSTLDQAISNYLSPSRSHRQHLLPEVPKSPVRLIPLTNFDRPITPVSVSTLQASFTPISLLTPTLGSEQRFAQDSDATSAALLARISALRSPRPAVYRPPSPTTPQTPLDVFDHDLTPIQSPVGNYTISPVISEPYQDEPDLHLDAEPEIIELPTEEDAELSRTIGNSSSPPANNLSSPSRSRQLGSPIDYLSANIFAQPAAQTQQSPMIQAHTSSNFPSPPLVSTPPRQSSPSDYVQTPQVSPLANPSPSHSSLSRRTPLRSPFEIQRAFEKASASVAEIAHRSNSPPNLQVNAGSSPAVDSRLREPEGELEVEAQIAEAKTNQSSHGTQPTVSPEVTVANDFADTSPSQHANLSPQSGPSARSPARNTLNSPQVTVTPPRTRKSFASIGDLAGSSSSIDSLGGHVSGDLSFETRNILSEIASSPSAGLLSSPVFKGISDLLRAENENSRERIQGLQFDAAQEDGLNDIPLRANDSGSGQHLRQSTPRRLETKNAESQSDLRSTPSEESSPIKQKSTPASLDRTLKKAPVYAIHLESPGRPLKSPRQSTPGKNVRRRTLAYELGQYNQQEVAQNDLVGVGIALHPAASSHNAAPTLNLSKSPKAAAYVPPTVQIRSADPEVAAHVAAILKVHHDFLPDVRHNNGKHRRKTSDRWAHLLHEAEDEIVSQMDDVSTRRSHFSASPGVRQRHLLPAPVFRLNTDDWSKANWRQLELSVKEAQREAYAHDEDQPDAEALVDYFVKTLDVHANQLAGHWSRQKLLYRVEALLQRRCDPATLAFLDTPDTLDRQMSVGASSRASSVAFEAYDRRHARAV